MGTRVAAAGLT